MYDRVIWPERCDPRTSAIYPLNDIDIKAPPEVVWKLLVDAENGRALESNSITCATSSPRTCSGVHGSAYAAIEALVETWMPEQVRHDG